METAEFVVSNDVVSTLCLVEACVHWEGMVGCRRKSDDNGVVTGAKAAATPTNNKSAIPQVVALRANETVLKAIIGAIIS